jgi:ATP-dependent DNA helicase PIF1
LTKLYSTRNDIAKENVDHLAKLPGAEIQFTAQDDGPPWAFDEKKLSTWSTAPAVLRLKIGAQVVLLKNLDIANGLVNGSRGVIVGLAPNHAPVVRFACGITMTMERVTWSLQQQPQHDQQHARRSYSLPIPS